MFNPYLANFLLNISLPIFSESFEIIFLIEFLILDLAFEDTTYFNQSFEGSRFLLIIISIASPLFNLYENGTMAPFTRAPEHLFPKSVWIAYAKSITQESIGNSFNSPLGVKT